MLLINKQELKHCGKPVELGYGFINDGFGGYICCVKCQKLLIVVPDNNRVPKVGRPKV